MQTRRWTSWGILAGLLIVIFFVIKSRQDTAVPVATHPAPHPASPPRDVTASHNLVVPPPANGRVVTRSPAKPRVATDAPRFNTLEEYRDELASRPVTPQPLDSQNGVKTPESEVRRIQTTLRKFRAAIGQNPVGSNPEITKALLGGNSAGSKFLDPASVVINDKGEWIDDWGRPYFFHAVSASLMEIRSAGPDQKLFNADDIVRP